MWWWKIGADIHEKALRQKYGDKAYEEADRKLRLSRFRFIRYYAARFLKRFGIRIKKREEE